MVNQRTELHGIGALSKIIQAVHIYALVVLVGLYFEGDGVVVDWTSAKMGYRFVRSSGYLIHYSIAPAM